MPADPSPTWDGAPPPDLPRATLLQHVRLVLRALTLIVLTYFGMIFVLIFNLIERWKFLGVSHWIVCLWGKVCLWLCGVRLKTIGTPMPHGGAIVSNHVGWIDIFTMLAADKVYFVSKAEVRRWPVIGRLSRQIDPVYIDRRRSGAKKHQQQLHERLVRGDRLCFFPEGTSTDGLRVLRFKSTLFNTFLTDELREEIWVQPVSLVYLPRKGLPQNFYGWWGDMPLGAQLKSVFSLSDGGIVTPLEDAKPNRCQK